MAKRFTDTEKWNDEWFMELDPALKCFWIYICDKCDHAGVWKVNFRLASVSIGAMIDKQSALKAFGDRVWEVSLEKWFIQKFIYFQYPSGLSDNNKAHNGVLKSLTSNNIDSRPFQAPLKLLGSPLVAPLRGVQDKDMDKEMDTSSFSSLKEESVKKILSSVQGEEKLKIDEVQNLFNSTLAKKAGKIEFCKSLSGVSHSDFATTTSFKEFQDISTWEEIFEKVAASDFLKGLETNFVASLNWLLIHNNASKVLNGAFPATSRKQKGGKSAGIAPTPDNPTGDPYQAELNQIRKNGAIA